MISVRDVHKVFRQGEAEVRALAGVSLDIAAGEFVSIMGPSGSGKSTLLHLMGGLDVPTAGEIVIEGTPISRMSDDEITIFRRRKIGFVFQFFNLLPTYSAEENVALPLLLARRGLRRTDDHARGREGGRRGVGLTATSPRGARRAGGGSSPRPGRRDRRRRGGTTGGGRTPR